MSCRLRTVCVPIWGRWNRPLPRGIAMRRQTINNVKGKIIAAGLYRPARFLFDHLDRARLVERRQRRNFYRALIRPGDLCFDVGANIGDYTDAPVSLGARVIAIEPQPACIDELRARFAGDLFVTIVPVAVGEAERTAKLFLREHTNVASLIEGWGGYHNLDAFDVPVKTLDQLIKRYGHPKYIKIDVEGFELPVIRGLHSKVELISFEYHLRDKDDCAAKLQIIHLLRQFGEVQFAALGEGETDWSIRWTGLDDFLKVFPERMPSTLALGDIFCKFV